MELEAKRSPVTEATPPTQSRKCPRCEATVPLYEPTSGAAVPIHMRMCPSRVNREGGREYFVCPRCEQREMLYGYDPDDHFTPEDWPVPIDILVEEERRLLTLYRKLAFRTCTPRS
jgi:hypothetical protein